jgi:hypothetical protein
MSVTLDLDHHHDGSASTRATTFADAPRPPHRGVGCTGEIKARIARIERAKKASEVAAKVRSGEQSTSAAESSAKVKPQLRGGEARWSGKQLLSKDKKENSLSAESSDKQKIAPKKDNRKSTAKEHKVPEKKKLRNAAEITPPTNRMVSQRRRRERLSTATTYPLRRRNARRRRHR